MDPERWRKVAAVFHTVVDHPLAERAALLDRACGDDPDLRREVEALVAADAEGTDVLSRPPEEVFAALTTTPLARGQAGGETATRIGPYTLGPLLGRGGMGVVYHAEREDVGLTCALKVVRGALTTPSGHKRFLVERRVLARLAHPHIARMLDAGITRDGDPWFAMELVQGEPIDRYCDHHRLTIDQRLALFERVCGAVAYAHRNLIVHRDLKPGNILVAEGGEPKLLDFGIAKLLGEEEEPLTATGVHPHTPGYAAPEQLTGAPVTTATDVYALGLVLYRLLCGRHPFAPGRESAEEAARRALSVVPARPSTMVKRAPASQRGSAAASAEAPAVAAAARGTTVAQLRRQLTGDLDAIVMRALAPEPDLRYSSAAALLDELRRHRQGLPVTARPDTWLYRARALARRNRVAVAGAAGLVVLLAGFAVTMAVQQRATARQRDRAEAALALATAQSAKAKRVGDFLVQLFDVADPFSAQAVRAESTSVRDFLVARGRMVTRLDDEPDVQLAAMGAVGHMYLSLGLHAEAESLLTQAVRLGRRLHPEGGPDQADALANLGEVERVRGEFAASERDYREALRMARAVTPGPHLALVSALHGLGDLLRQSGRYPEAERLLREALDVRRTLSGDSSVSVSDGLNNLGLVLWARGQLDSAAPLLEEALAIQRARLPQPHPMTAAVLNNLGLVRRDQGDLPAAEAALREALTMKQELFGERQWRVANGMRNLAAVLFAEGRMDAAERYARDGLAVIRANFGERHELVPSSLALLGQIRETQGRRAEAERLYRQALGSAEAFLPAGHPRISENEVLLGGLLTRTGRAAEARPLLEQAVRAYTLRDGPDHQRTVQARALLDTAVAAGGAVPEPGTSH